jgi:hypothetical protein
LKHSTIIYVDLGEAPSDPIDHDFASMVDYMVYQVWNCQRSLSFAHKTKDCVNDIRCSVSFNYGNIKRNCLNGRANSGKVKIPKKAKRLMLAQNLLMF